MSKIILNLDTLIERWFNDHWVTIWQLDGI